MPRARPVEFHARRYTVVGIEPYSASTRGRRRRVGADKSFTVVFCSDERETPGGKPLASGICAVIL